MGFSIKSIVDFRNLQGFKGYFIITICFVLGLALSILLFDNYLMRYIIGSRDIVKIPDLIGMSANDAELKVQLLGLEYVKSSEQFNLKFNPGTVVNQIPRAGIEVKTGRKIFCTLSKGRELIKMPFLIGRTIRTSVTMLQQSGLCVGELIYSFSDSIGKDTVIGQIKQGGSMVPYGDTISIIVSKGALKQLQTPNLIGYPFPEALKILTENGFKLGSTDYIKDGTYLKNTVIKQDPASGESVPDNSIINLTITK
ncbi:MAG: PASTA domain-containing protein [Candidatus Kapabacteria bacterium]|nr:PASTA domain-containing protein [Candidatus Kapabacteria bacterium]